MSLHTDAVPGLPLGATWPTQAVITDTRGGRRLILEAPNGGADTCWLWARDDTRPWLDATVGIELHPPGWHALAVTAGRVARALAPPPPLTVAQLVKAVELCQRVPSAAEAGRAEPLLMQLAELLHHRTTPTRTGA